MDAPISKEVNILDVKGYLIGKCIQDQNFMTFFLKNPKQALKEELKIDLPEDLKITVVEDNDNLIHVTLPLMRDIQEVSKISDEDLNTLAKKCDLQMNTPLLKLFLILKSIKHPSFKKLLLADPKGTLEKELKIQVPDQIEIKVLEDKEKLLYVALPSKQIIKAVKEKLSELSEEELKEIVGGSASEFGAFLKTAATTILMPVLAAGATFDESSREILIEYWTGKMLRK